MERKTAGVCGSESCRAAQRRPGGNDLTDILGVDAKALGYKGVIFPSVRALMYESELPKKVAIRQDFDAIKHMSAAGNIMDLE